MEPENKTISSGCHVELNFLDREGQRERLSVDIVPDKSADFTHNFLGESTPLAKILIGEKAGTVIPYLMDDILAIEVISVTISTARPAEDAQEKRQAQIEKTKKEVEHTSAVVFASSFSGKWGDYDPDSLPKEGNPEKDKEEQKHKAKH